MIFSKLICFTLTLTVPALTLHVTRRDYALIYSDLQAADARFRACVSAVNNCTCTTAQFSALVNCAKSIETALKKTQDDCNATPVTPTVSTAQAQQYIDYTNNPFVPDITAYISALISKKTSFDAAGISSVFKPHLRNLRTYIINECSCFKARSPSGKQSAEKVACDRATAQIDRGQAVYGS